MVIDKIGNINNIIETKKTSKLASAKQVKKNDSIQISSEGKQAAEIAKVNKIVNDTPDIRTEKVNKLKEQIANGTYDFNDDKLLEKVADKIATFLMRQ